MTEAVTTRDPRSTYYGATFLLVLFAGLVTLVVLRTAYPFFEVEKQYEIQGLGASDEAWSTYNKQQRLVDIKNAALLVGILGSTLGVALACMLRPAAGSPAWRLLMGAAGGLFIGALAGGGASYLQQFFASQGRLTLLQSVMVQTLLFGTLGLGLGAIAGGLAKHRSIFLERIVSGVAAGLIAGVAYPFLISMLLATASIDTVVPSVPAAQAMWLALAAGLFGWLIPRTSGTPEPRQLENDV